MIFMLNINILGSDHPLHSSFLKIVFEIKKEK